MYELVMMNKVIQLYHTTHTTLNKISYNLKIPKSTLYNWQKRYPNNFKYGIYITTQIIKDSLNRKPTLIDLYKETIINYINNNIVNRKKDILINNPELKISLTTISRIIKMANYSYKNIKTTVCTHSKEALTKKRIEYSENLNITNYVNYISIDETSFCINDYSKKCYSLKGVKVENIMKHQRIRERYTLLLAISNKNIVGYKLFKGGLKIDIYKNFLIDNKENFKGKTLLKDNLATHKNKSILEYCKENNIKLSFIPPYSPDFNPIENYFSEIKRHYRRDKERDNLEETIIRSINKSNKHNLINYYENSIKTINYYKSIKDTFDNI